jgi:hypothetical protein
MFEARQQASAQPAASFPMVIPEAFIISFVRFYPDFVLPGLEPPTNPEKRMRAQRTLLSGITTKWPHQQSTPGRAIERASRCLLIYPQKDWS